MFTYAQTNIQLYTQLQKLGISTDGQKCLFNAYTLAAELFGGAYRASGKTFVAHLVGTASVLIKHGASAEVAAGGLLHAAILHGDYGYSWFGKVPNRYKEIEQRVGPQVAALVLAFSRTPWNEHDILNTPDQSNNSDPLSRNVFFIRLANEVDVLMDNNIQFCANADQRVARLQKIHVREAQLADELGYASLAEELRRLFQHNLNATGISALSGSENNSYRLPPRSMQPKSGSLFIQIRRLIWRGVR